MTENNPEDLPRSISFDDEACPSPFFAPREGEGKSQAPANPPPSPGHPGALTDPAETTQVAQPMEDPAAPGITPPIPE